MEAPIETRAQRTLQTLEVILVQSAHFIDGKIEAHGEEVTCPKA